MNAEPSGHVTCFLLRQPFRRYPHDVAEEIKTPVAIRVARPYASDDDFLQHEIDTLTRTTVTLLGAQSRPQGVILRFEVTLATGVPLLRGEGRVVAFRQASQGVDAGLTLRFTRLDARSKALVDRAASLREARARSGSVHPPRLEGGPTPAPPELAPNAPAASFSPRAPPPLPSNAQTRANSVPPPLPNRASAAPARMEVAAPAPEPVAPPARIEIAAPAGIDLATPSRRPAPSLRAPPSRRREELLDRLRQRAKKLSATEVEALFASHPKRARRTEL